MPITFPHLNHWMQNFYGYGSWEAPVWFVAFEEGGGDLPLEVQEKIEYFQKNHPANSPTLCDIRALYQHVTVTIEGPRASQFQTLYDYRFGKNAVQHGSWKNLIAFVHAYLGKPIPDLIKYQKASFLSPNLKRENLIQLYPLPSPHNHAWYYSWLDMPQMPYLRSRQEYQDHVYQSRIETILEMVKARKPELVLMYGMSNINSLKASILASFPNTQFALSKATKLKLPQYHFANLGDTKLVVTTQIPTLRHHRVETGYDWELFGKRLSGRN